jgi:hypothetical protein
MDWASVGLSILGGAGGGVLTIFGLSKWLGKVWADRLLEKFKQQNRIELENIRNVSNAEIVKLQNTLERANKILDVSVQKATFVTRTQFETEFSAYKEIFAALSALSHCLAATRPGLRVAREGETKEDKIRELEVNYAALVQAHNTAISLKQNLAPFYAVDIYDALAVCLTESGGEIMDLQMSTGRPEQFAVGWYQQGSQRLERFQQGYFQVGNLIRQRIASLGILPS